MRSKPSRRGSGAKPQTIDEYLAIVSPDKRAALEKLRRAIHAAAPGVVECLSYQMPAFRLDGKVLVWYGAGAQHCAFYPGAVVQDHLEELAGYETSKGTIRFQPDHSLPAALVRKLVNARIAASAVPARRSESGPAGRTRRTRR